MSVDTHEDRVRGLWSAISLLDDEAVSLGLEEVGHLLSCARASLEETTIPMPSLPHLRLVHSCE
jgi:hypothetical protein